MNISSNHSIILITGKDSDEFLQGQITNDISLLSDDNFIESAVCNVQGRVIAFFMIKKIENGFLIAILDSLSHKFLSHLEKYSVFFKVKISFSKSIDKGIKIINYETWNEYCIENGKAEVSVDLSEKFTPHELNYHKTNIVNFEKGCFTGQEVIARMHYRGKLKFALARFEIESNELLKPSQIILDSSGKKVGQIIIYSNKMGLISLKNTSNLKNIFFLEEGKEVAFKSLDVI